MLTGVGLQASGLLFIAPCVSPSGGSVRSIPGMGEGVGGLPNPGCCPSHQIALLAAPKAVVINDTNFQTSSSHSLVF